MAIIKSNKWTSPRPTTHPPPPLYWYLYFPWINHLAHHNKLEHEGGIVGLKDFKTMKVFVHE